MENRKKIITFINNSRIEIDGQDAFKPLALYLREVQGLTGTKVVCAEGDCGACTVLMARETGVDGKLVYKSVNSCILPLYLIDGAHVVTVEGLKKETELHPVQESMVNAHGAQCGYCTPGFVCAMAGLAEKFKCEDKEITEKKAKNYLTGNLCRCTGYKPIIEAAVNIDLPNMELLKDRFHNPAWLSEMKKIKSSSLMMKLNEKTIFLPARLDEALKAKKENTDLRIVAGSTDLGVVVNKGKLETPKAMSLQHIAELAQITHTDSEIIVGANATLSALEDYIEHFIPELKRILHIFASPQIKNQGTLTGNVVNASPIGDTIPFLMAIDARVVLKNDKATREVVLSKFYLGYKKLDLASDEIVVAIKIPRPKKTQEMRLYKVSVRKDLDISAVTFAGLVERENGKIKEARIAFGGVGPTVLRLKGAEDLLTGADFNEKTFKDVSLIAPTMISPLSDLRASKEYRLKLAENFFMKFYHDLNSGVNP